MAMNRRALLEEAFAVAVAACKRAETIIAALPPRPKGRVLVIAAGKGAVPMAQAVEQRWPDATGLAVTRTGYGGPLTRIELVEASHPVPDAAGLAAAERCLALAESAGEGDLLLVLLSGGASALLAAPSPPLDLAAKQAVTRALVRSGASIGEINMVRRHLSRIKGGRLAAAAWPAQVVTLAVSDVVGDVPQDIGSGPTVGDESTVAQAQAVLARYGIADPGGWSESIKPDDPRLAESRFEVVVRPDDALDAAAAFLQAQGYEPVILDREAHGDAREVARRHAQAAILTHNRAQRCALLSGGELTVTVTGHGVGGPNQEYALELAGQIADHPGVAALAADTDGVDGNRDVAGAYVDGETGFALDEAGIDVEAVQAANDAGGALGQVGALFTPGPTLTNVNDLRIILVDP
ncbi:glycerate kinase [Sphingobium sp. B12D2B]|uniref:glycerate kinase type-2 family protein n=1 Tax=Sphingobium sp. B12D2B TaxID=2940577 RepID=UPI0022247A41|nr:glycerate kinase [Sphingobium sp. B12D2B]MCW2348987.1 hydroxypyruvate reductase [Sphingobium sp. B12D2B]